VAGLAGGRIVAVLPRRPRPSPAVTLLLEALRAAAPTLRPAAAVSPHGSSAASESSLSSPG
jgi:hypothetical protein